MRDDPLALRHHSPGDRPVVAVDVDDVLNVPSLTRPGLRSARVHIPAGLIGPSAFTARIPDDGLDVPVRWDPTVASWLADLIVRGDADVVWATTWEAAANAILAPLVGLDPIPYVEHSAWKARFGDARAGNSGAWKVEALDEVFAGRDVCWLDDRPSTYVPDIARGDVGLDAPGLVALAVDPRTGLTAEDLAVVDAWLAARAR